MSQFVRLSAPVLAVAFGVMVLFSTSAQSQSAEDSVSAAMVAIQKNMPEGEPLEFAKFLVDEQISPLVIGQALYARRQFDKAAWFFGADAILNGESADNLRRMSAMLVELHADDSLLYPDVVLLLAQRIAQQAVSLRAGDAATLDNFAVASSLLAALPGQSPRLLEDAIAAAERATSLAPEETLYWLNLARVYHQAGNEEGEKRALEKARNAKDGREAYEYGIIEFGLPPAEETASEPEQCNVDFRCEAICPKSIIGQINLISCEQENDTQQELCKAGEPYATSYNCDEAVPEYGILIPILNSGGSLCVPGFCMNILVKPDGTVDVRTEAGISLGPVTKYVGVDGHYNPSRGYSFDRYTSGTRLGLISRSPAGSLTSAYGHTPLQVESETVDGQTTNGIEVFNKSVTNGK